LKAAISKGLQPKRIMTGTGPAATFGKVSDIAIYTWISGQAELSTTPTNCFLNCRLAPRFDLARLSNLPPNRWNRVWNPAVDFAFEQLDNLGTALGPLVSAFRPGRTRVMPSCLSLF
jgi:hypothetical protein